MINSFENYTKTANSYDNTRNCVGIDIIEKNIHKNLNEVNMLDLACGTGNYSEYFVNKVNYLTCLDGNNECLDNCKKKLEGSSNVEFIYQNLSDKLSLEDNQFDVIIINQVLHHLIINNDDKKYDVIIHLIKELNRVLKPNGVIIMNYTTNDQQKFSYWWSQLIPSVTNIIDYKFLSNDIVSQLFQNNMNNCDLQFYPILDETLMKYENYINPQNLFNVDWRNGDSLFSFLNFDDNFKKNMTNLIENKEMSSLINKSEKHRRQYGQSTSVVIRKYIY
jgi:ubiquinone/menaquinone biosynthesis C-methylase UbiE